jgi:hypothetical protein
MATVDPTIALSAKAPDAMTGLGQMLNVARGAQAYQQQAESFPTLLEQQKLALNRSQQMLPIEVRQAEATAGTSEFGLNQKQLTLAGGMLTGLEYSDALKTGNIPELTSQLKTIEHVLKANGVPVEKTFGQVNSMLAAGDVKGVQNFIANLRTGFASPEQKYTAVLPQPMAGLNAPAAFIQGGPQGGTIQSTPIGTQAAPAQAPTQAPMTTVAPGVQTAPVAAPAPLQGQTLPPTGVTPQQMAMPTEALKASEPVPLPYPRRQAGQPYMPSPSEAADTTKNIAYRQAITDASKDMSAPKNAIREVLSSSDKIQKSMGGESWLSDWSTGVKGAVNRNVQKWLGTETGVELQRLNKDLANVALANIKAQGGSIDTVAGQQLTRMANGDETYPPQILKDIARRTQAELTNTEKQAQAANRFAEKFGDNNLYKFKQEWAKNADSKIFQAMNIYNDAKDPREAKTQIDALLGNDSRQRKIFFHKYNNIQKLIENGSL